ncbi:unnamed protein product, partial [Protopolystoma xenopodis]
MATPPARNYQLTGFTATAYFIKTCCCGYIRIAIDSKVVVRRGQPNLARSLHLDSVFLRLFVDIQNDINTRHYVAQIFQPKNIPLDCLGGHPIATRFWFEVRARGDGHGCHPVSGISTEAAHKPTPSPSLSPPR